MSENKSINVQNPITGKDIYSINEATDSQILEAMSKAREAEKVIANMSVEDRIKEVLKIKDWVLKNAEFILDTIIAETGKARFDALSSEVLGACNVVDTFKGIAPKALKDKKVPTPLLLMGKTSKVIYQPLGTVLVIAPWNYPFYQGIVPTILAFLAGNAVIHKPSEVTPLKPVWDKFIAESGFTKNAFQVIYGGREVGAAAIAAKPDKVHFTGSVNAGKKIMTQCGQDLIPVDLELGGKDAAIVFEDVNIERTVNGIIWGAFTNSGQSCTSIERVYIQESIYEPMVKMLVEKTQKIRVSNAQSNTSAPADFDLGAITSPHQIAIIEEHIEEAVSKGAKVLCGGIKEKGSAHIPPTIVSEVTHDMKLGFEETFGPVVAIMKFKTEAEAINLANDSAYGLGGSVWTKDLSRGERVAKAIKTGSININNHMVNEANPHLPFGGIKNSGIGRVKSELGLHTFCNIKAIIIDKQSSKIESHWYPFTKEKYSLLSNLMQSFFARSRNWIKFVGSALPIDTIGNKQKL